MGGEVVDRIKEFPTEKMLRDLETIKNKAEAGKVIDDPRVMRQLLQSICWMAAEYVVPSIAKGDSYVLAKWKAPVKADIFCNGLPGSQSSFMLA